MRGHLAYLSYLARHKWFVFVASLRTGVPLLGLMHDLVKLHPAEFFPYSRFFYEPDGTSKVRRNATGYYKPTDTGDPAFDLAWLHHVRNTKHHWQAWAVPDASVNGYVKVYEMPERYRREMVADWEGASRAQGIYQGPETTRAWYRANRTKLMLGPRTRAWIEAFIGFGEIQSDPEPQGKPRCTYDQTPGGMERCPACAPAPQEAERQ